MVYLSRYNVYKHLHVSLFLCDSALQVEGFAQTENGDVADSSFRLLPYITIISHSFELISVIDSGCQATCLN